LEANQNQFADADCQLPTYGGDAVWHLTDNDPLVSVPLPRDGCDPQRHLVGKLVQFPQGAPYFTLDAAGNCVNQGPLPDASTLTGVVVDIVSPEAWVSGAEAAGPLLASRLRMRAVQTADGAAFPDHFVDEHWSRPCTLRTSSNSDLGCWPDTAEVGSLHTDSDCSSPPVVFGGACDSAAFIESGVQLLALGDRYTGPVFERIKECREIADGPAASASYFQVGAALAADAVAPAAWQLAGTGRLQLRGLRDDDGSLVPIRDDMRASLLPAFHDTLANADCTPVWTPQNEVRCLPTSVAVSAYGYDSYADASCTERAYYCFDAKCTDFVPTAVTYRGLTHADSVHQAIALGHPAYSLGGGTCTEMADSPLNLFRAGPEVPWDKYPLLSELNGEAPANR
jgi:hypothetical protein